MPEAAIVFKETERERNELRKCAAHKKNGSAIPKLGKRVMSWQEIASKHGECKSYNFNSFMTFSSFVTMADDLQIEYINKYCGKYGIGIRALSKYLFELSENDLEEYLKEKNLNDKFDALLYKLPMDYHVNLLRYDIADWKRRTNNMEVTDNMAKETQFLDFITYEDYMKLDKYERMKYVNYLVEKYHVSHGFISVVLFDRSKDAIGAVARDNETLKDFLKPDRTGEKKAEWDARFTEAVNQWKASLKTNEEVKEMPVQEVSEPIVETEPVAEPEPVVEEAKTETFEPLIEYINKAEASEETAEPVEEYHDFTFESNYIREGLDMDEIYAISRLIRNRKVRVMLTVTAI